MAERGVLQTAMGRMIVKFQLPGPLLDLKANE